MARIIRPKMFKWKAPCIAVVIALVPALIAQQATQPGQMANPASANSAAAVPGPPQPRALFKVFIYNVPGEEEPGGLEGPDKAYNSFYAAMQRAGQYELVADPDQADLLFELLYARPWHCAVTEEFDPFIAVNAFDRKTHALWKMQAAGIDQRYSRKTADKIFEQASKTLVELMGTGPVSKAGTIAVPERPSPGPAPSRFAAATTLFISSHVVDKTRAMDNPQDFYTQVYAEMQKWGRYKLVSNAADADLVADLAVTQAGGPKCPGSESTPTRQVELRITVPSTNTLLWGFAESLRGWHTLWSKHGFGSSQGDVKRTSVSLVNQIRELTARADAAAGRSSGTSLHQSSSH